MYKAKIICTLQKKDANLYKTYEEAKEAIEEQLENFIANPDIAPSDFRVVIEEVNIK